MSQTAATNMLRRTKTPGDSDTRHSTSKPHSKIKTTVNNGATVYLANSTVPNPIMNKPIKRPSIPHTHSLSLELTLNTNLLEQNSAVTNPGNNPTALLPERRTTITECHGPVRQKTATAFGENTLCENLTNTYQNAYVSQPTGTRTLGHTNQITFHPKIIADLPGIFEPNRAITITSNSTRAPHKPDGLYSIKNDNRIQTTIKNANMRPNKSLKDKLSTGITVHLLDEEYHEEIPIPKDTLRTCFRASEVLTNEYNPSQLGIIPKTKGYTPKQHLENKIKNLRHATPLLKESGIYAPDPREKPARGPSHEVTKDLLKQIDNKDIEQKEVPAYQQPILCGHDAFSFNKFDTGHTMHNHHRIKCTTNQPGQVQRFKNIVIDEQTLDDFASNPTTARILIGQPSTHSTSFSTVATKSDLNTNNKQLMQDPGRQNAASQDNKYTIRDVRKSLPTTDRSKPEACYTYDFMNASYNPPGKKSSQRWTPFTPPFKSARHNRIRMPRGLRMANTAPIKLNRLMHQKRQNIVTHTNDIMTTRITHQIMSKTINVILTKCHDIKLNLKLRILKMEEPTGPEYSRNKLNGTPERDESKTTKVMVPPKLVKETRNHFDSFRFFHEPIQNYKQIPTPLRRTTDPDFNLPFQPHIDTSVRQEHHNPPVRTRVGTILTQIQGDTTRPTEYPGRRFEGSKCKNKAHNTELPGMKESLNNLYYYPRGPTTVINHLPIMENDSANQALGIKTSEIEVERTHSKGNTIPANTPFGQSPPGDHPGTEETRHTGIKTQLVTTTATANIGIARPPNVSNKQWKFEQSGKPLNKNAKQCIRDRKPSLILGAEYTTASQGNKTCTHEIREIYMDAMSPLTPPRGQKHTPIITDTFTKYTKLIAKPDKETTSMAKTLLDRWILRHGFYEQTTKITQNEQIERAHQILREEHRRPRTCIHRLKYHGPGENQESHTQNLPPIADNTLPPQTNNLSQ